MRVAAMRLRSTPNSVVQHGGGSVAAGVLNKSGLRTPALASETSCCNGCKCRSCCRCCTCSGSRRKESNSCACFACRFQHKRSRFKTCQQANSETKCACVGTEKATAQRLRARRCTRLLPARKQHHYSARCSADAGAQTAPPRHKEKVDER